MKKGFSLVEVLIVIAIVVLISALVFPVIARSRRSAKAATCTSNLRQVYVAWQMYTDLYDGEPPRTMLPIVDSAIEGVLQCPMDNLVPAANLHVSNTSSVKVSYFEPDPVASYRDAMLAADPNHGVFACTLHGEVVSNSLVDPLLDTTGLVLRARRDGSIQRAKVGFVCLGGKGGSALKTRLNWTLFTDEWPGPEPWVPAGSYKCD